MALDIETKTVEVLVRERSWRVEIFCELEDDPVIRVHRETITVGPDGSVYGASRGRVIERSLSQIVDSKINGVSMGTLAEYIAKAADTWAAEDVTREAAAVAAAAAPAEK